MNYVLNIVKRYVLVFLKLGFIKLLYCDSSVYYCGVVNKWIVCFWYCFGFYVFFWVFN